MRDPKDILINSKQLSEILESHKNWLLDTSKGERANLREANLWGADLREANLWEANLRGANLREADLREANLREANLRGANLREANLWEANLWEANLREANLWGADLREANFWEANLWGADLREANLWEADLQGANLREANLWGADLWGADLWEADLRGANLQGAKNIEMADAITRILPDGDLIGYKKCNNGVIVTLQIPAGAKRSNATGRKCRAEYVVVLRVEGAEFGVTNSHGPRTEYRVDQTVHCDHWDDNRWEECSGGIHFFITRWEAENYS